MSNDTSSLFLAWRNDPTLFIKQAFALPDGYIQPWQAECLQAINENNLISIRSGKGCGKSTFLCWVILWFMATRPNVKIPCTSPSGDQLRDVLWADLQMWINRINPDLKPLLPYEWGATRITFHDNFAVARTSRREQPEALQGFHAENVLMIVDEASGVPDEVYKAAEGAFTTEGARMILTSNPTQVSGYFFDTHNKMRGRWWTYHVSCVTSSIVSSDYIEMMREKWGEDSNEFRIGVLGDFPLGGANTIIPLHLVLSATTRPATPDQNSDVVWGVDVARFGSDRFAVAKRKNRQLLEPVTFWQGKDLMQSAAMIADMYHATKSVDRPTEINVDSIGVGGGVVDILRGMNLPVRGVNVGERKAVRKDYLCLRDELWWRAREWFESLEVSIPQDDDLIAELTAIEYDYNSMNKRFVKDKHALGWSPDLADAFILTFAGIKGRMESYRDRLHTPIQMPTYAITDASYVEEYRYAHVEP